MIDHLLSNVAHVGEVLPPAVVRELRQVVSQEVLLERLPLEAFHLFVDGALDFIYLDVLIISSITKQCGKLVVSLIALAGSTATRNIATAEAFIALGRTPSAIAFSQSSRDCKRAGPDLLPYRLRPLLHFVVRRWHKHATGLGQRSLTEVSPQLHELENRFDDERGQQRN